MHQEKVQQEKLKAVKARLNFEETSQYSESGAQSKRRDVKKRLGPKDAHSMSRSPVPGHGRGRTVGDANVVSNVQFHTHRKRKGLV
ncbi:hypothetical protein Tco_0054948 [Tanacetum coccineum]